MIRPTRHQFKIGEYTKICIGGMDMWYSIDNCSDFISLKKADHVATFPGSKLGTTNNRVVAGTIFCWRIHLFTFFLFLLLSWHQRFIRVPLFCFRKLDFFELVLSVLQEAFPPLEFPILILPGVSKSHVLIRFRIRIWIIIGSRPELVR